MIVETNHDLKGLNTFGIAAKAEAFVRVGSEADLKKLLRAGNRPTYIIGGGSNLLLTGDLAGLTVQNAIRGISITADTPTESIVSVGGGQPWHSLVLWALDHNLGGIENLALIPGSAGAAPIQNIGAYGVELKDVFQQLEAVDLDSGKTKVFDAAECQFGYRDSIFKNELKGKYFITRILLRLSKRHQLRTGYGAIADTLRGKNIESPTIRDVANAVIEIRQSKLPDPAKIGNAGSFFKNPEINADHFTHLRTRFPDLAFYEMPGDTYKIPAGWLIEKAGWKGRRIGDAGCHEKQALVLVNHGQATGSDIRHLAGKIQYDVMEMFGVGIVPEVVVW